MQTFEREDFSEGCELFMSMSGKKRGRRFIKSNNSRSPQGPLHVLVSECTKFVNSLYLVDKVI